MFRLRIFLHRSFLLSDPFNPWFSKRSCYENSPFLQNSSRDSVVMGTKRPFDEDLQEFIKHPKHLENGNKPDPFGEEDKHTLETSHNLGITGEHGATFFQTGDSIKTEKLNPVTEMANEFETSEHSRENIPAPVFPSNLFPEFFEFNMPRRQLVHFDDTYSSILNNSPRKQVPIGPDHQADVPDFDPDLARNLSENREKSSLGVIVNSPPSETECKCLDSGSIRCVQQHINEVRLKLKNSLGLDKFIDLGLHEMGEEVSHNWTDEEQQLFQDVVYSNPVSLGRRFWEQLSIAFRSRTKKELVSYYFNVFMLRRRAVQNRSNLLEIDSDDDEWWGSKRGPFGEDGDDHGDILVGVYGGDLHDDKTVSESEQEKVNGGGLRSESYLHWDPPYSTMGSTKGVDLLPTCSMIEEIFGSSKNGKNT
ncbi:unnamed protein product [Lactuca virosa]|uniref:Myb-like domain-containing protein n=1 Tax=Lactuca virosa TaxID=75947 RepID=A0AAU9N181_9ASTR|nr:unnamed protein product [Lactuca virosa]